MAMAWYVVNAFSGYEGKAKRALEERIAQAGLEDRFGDILVPKEDVVEVKGGQKRSVARKFFPGYMLVQMELDNQTWHVVRNTPKITGFVGGNNRRPPPVPEAEVQRIIRRMGLDEGGEPRPKPKLNFDRNEEVRIMEGAFATMNGIVEEVNQARGKLRVMVNLFGRPTSVELDFTQVEKLS
ncbi:MAG: transcription termination/antitermination protein NusG [Myxococcota bacterium]|nr:transcription termination/antitermination protein NusG [Myxococcota bacterium]